MSGATYNPFMGLNSFHADPLLLGSMDSALRSQRVKAKPNQDPFDLF